MHSNSKSDFIIKFIDMKILPLIIVGLGLVMAIGNKLVRKG